MTSFKQISKQAKKVESAFHQAKFGDYEAALRSIGSNNSQPGVGNYGRYLVGYSLLKLGRPLEALSHWSPLIKNAKPPLQNDIKALLGEILNEASTEKNTVLDRPARLPTLSLPELKDLFSASLYFKVNHPFVRELERYLFNRLWTERKLDELRSIVMSAPAEMAAKLIIEARIGFANPRKSGHDAFAFGSLVMSAGVCYFQMRGEWESTEAKSLFESLALEIRVCPLEKSGSEQKDDSRSFRQFLSLEIRAAEDIAQLGSAKPYAGAVMTPGFCYHHRISEPVREKFVNWLREAGASAKLLALYDRKIFSFLHAAFNGMLGDAPSPEFNLVAKAASFEFVARGNRSPPPAPPLNTAFDSETSDQWSNEAVEIAKSAIFEIVEKNRELPPSFFFRLINFAKVTKSWDLLEVGLLGELKILMGILIRSRVEELNENISKIDQCLLLHHANSIESSELSKTYSLRGKQCIEFLQSFAKSARKGMRGKKKITPSLKAIIATESSFREHISLLADCVALVNLVPRHLREEESFLSATGFSSIGSLGRPLMDHFYKIIKKPGYFNENLEPLRGAVADCTCPSCELDFFNRIPAVAKQIGCAPSVFELKIPWLEKMRAIRKQELEKSPDISVFNSEDPFDVLGVTPATAKQSILAATMKAMQVRPSEMPRLRSAQSQSFDPKIRFLYGLLKAKESPSLIEGISNGEAPSFAPIDTLILRSKELLQ